MEEDGSLKCELLWAPTTVSVSTLKESFLSEPKMEPRHGTSGLRCMERPAAAEGTIRDGSNRCLRYQRMCVHIEMSTPTDNSLQKCVHLLPEMMGPYLALETKLS